MESVCYRCRYLHEVCSPSIVHKNIKSANILLDSELNPHLSDCGLASFLPTANEVCTPPTVAGHPAFSFGSVILVFDFFFLS